MPALPPWSGLLPFPTLGRAGTGAARARAPSRSAAARPRTPDGLLELRGCRLDARVPFRGAQFLEERVDLASDEVDERHVEGASGVRDERDRSLDVASLARLDGVVDDPFPFFDLEPDPLGRDEERLHLVHQFREFAVEELSVSGWNSAFRFPSGPPQLVDPVLEGAPRRLRGGRGTCERARHGSLRPDGLDDRGWTTDFPHRGGHGLRVFRESNPATRAAVRVRRDRGLAHGAFVFRRFAFGELRPATRTPGRVRPAQRLADGAKELLAQVGSGPPGG